MPDFSAPHILLFGANGQVGHALRATLARIGPVSALNRDQVDVRDEAVLRGVFLQRRPDIVVNASAYTAVDRAEADQDAAFAINATAPRIMAEECEKTGASLIHYSTDYVFDGFKSDPYSEDDVPNPLGVYGQSKLAGERAIQSSMNNYLIFRTSWVTGLHGTNFLKTMLRLAAERDTLRVVGDQFGAPTTAELLADVTSRVVAGLGKREWDNPWGLYHVTAAGSTSWCGYATHIIRRAQAVCGRIKCKSTSVRCIPASEYPTPAQRPANSRLNTCRFRETFGIELAHWTTGVDSLVDQLCSATAND